MSDTPLFPETPAAETPPLTEKPAPPPAPAPPAVNPLAADLAAARSKLAEYENRDKTEAEAKRLAEEKKLAEKGEFDKLIKQRDEQLEAERKRAEDTINRSKKLAIKSEIHAAFAGHDLYEGSAEDLLKLWSDEFEATADGDSWVVRSKDGRPVKDVINERLASPRYWNHVKATARSGAGGGNGHVPAPTPPSDPNAEPKNYEEWKKRALGTDQRDSGLTVGLAGRRKPK